MCDCILHDVVKQLLESRLWKKIPPLQKDWSQCGFSSYFHQVVSCSSGVMLIELRVKLGHAAELWLQRIFQQNSIKTLSGREISLNKHCFRILEVSSTCSVVWNGACGRVLTILGAVIYIFAFTTQIYHFVNLPLSCFKLIQLVSHF